MVVQNLRVIICAIILNSAIFWINIGEVDGNAKILVLMETYRDPDFTLENGARCEGTVFFHKWCSPRFQYCLGNESRDICETKTIIDGPYKEARDLLFPQHGKLMNGVMNPILFTVSKLTTQLKLLMMVYQNKSNNVITRMTGALYLPSLKPTKSENDAIYTHILISDKKSVKALTIKYKIWCESNSYGNDCGTICIERNDDVNGHYTCSKNGQKICSHGWTNPAANCTKRISTCQMGNPCKNGGSCREGETWNDFTCICTPGFQGKTCTDMIPTTLPTTPQPTTTIRQPTTTTRQPTTTTRQPTTTTRQPTTTTPQPTTTTPQPTTITRQPTTTTPQPTTTTRQPTATTPQPTTTTPQPTTLAQVSTESSTTFQPHSTSGPRHSVWPLAFVGCLSTDQIASLKTALIRIFQLTHGPSAIIRVHLRTEKAITYDYSYITLVHLRVSVNGTELHWKTLVKMIFHHEDECLDLAFPAELYYGKWLYIKNDCKKDDEEASSQILDYLRLGVTPNNKDVSEKDLVKENIILKLKLEILSLRKLCGSA